MAPSAKDHCEVVLAAIIPDRRDLLDKAMLHLDEVHFPDITYKNIFIMIRRVYEVNGSVMTVMALEDLLRKMGADPGKALAYKETYQLLSDRNVSDADFRWSLQELRELAGARATQDAMVQAMEILTKGATGEKGEELRGANDARTHILSKFAEIDRDLGMQESPEGDMRIETDDILKLYFEAKQRGGKSGLLFGIPSLDAKAGGLDSGELGLVVGYTGTGKSQFSVQAMHHNAVEEGKNVVYLTTETLRPQVRTRLVARHSVMPEFELPGGLNSRDLSRGTLSSDEEEKLQEVLHDLDKNPNYGKMYIVQLPRRATLSTIESRLISIQRKFNIDFCIIDYLTLLSSDRRRDSGREELSSIVKDAKMLATTFDDGRGIPILSPWQVNRTSWAKAQEDGYYTLSALAETSEASNTPDLIVSLLEPPNNDERKVAMKGQVLKNRTGETASNIELYLDRATSYFSEDSGSGQLDDLLGTMSFV